MTQVCGVRRQIDEREVESEGLEEVGEGEEVEYVLPGVAAGLVETAFNDSKGRLGTDDFLILRGPGLEKQHRWSGDQDYYAGKRQESPSESVSSKQNFGENGKSKTKEVRDAE